MMLFVNYIYVTPTTPIYEGAFVKEGLNLSVGISGFMGEDGKGDYFRKREVVGLDSVRVCETDPWGVGDCHWEYYTKYNWYEVSKDRTYFKKGLKADIRLGYNLSTLMRRIFYLEPFIDLEPYINLGYQMYMYNEICRTCYSNCMKECKDGCIDSTYNAKIYRGEYPSIGLKIVTHSENVRVGVDLNGGYFDHHLYAYGEPYFYAKLLIGFGYPEVISASLLLGGHSFETSCYQFFDSFGCGPDVDLYSAISLQYNYRNYFISATITIHNMGSIGRIDIGIGHALR